MDVKRIDQLPEATEPKGTDLLPLWQGEGTKKVPLAAIQASGPDGMRPAGCPARTEVRCVGREAGGRPGRRRHGVE